MLLRQLSAMCALRSRLQQLCRRPLQILQRWTPAASCASIIRRYRLDQMICADLLITSVLELSLSALLAVMHVINHLYKH